MNGITWLVLCCAANQTISPTPANSAARPVVTAMPPTAPPLTYSPAPAAGAVFVEEAAGGLFAGDHAFDRFLGPVSNPVLAKDPRVFTETRLIFVNNKAPADHPVLAGDDVQLYAVALRLALTERLALIADKSGYAVIDSKTSGFNNLAAGLKYELIRDPENQFLLTIGGMYEMPSGQAKVFQGIGSGIFTAFATVGKEFLEDAHVLATVGYQFPASSDDFSSFFYGSLHLDYCLFDCFYPLAELNWFGYTAGGNCGIPSIVGEGDGLVNLGTSGVGGNNLVTLAFGFGYKPGKHVELSGAFEFPVSDRKDLIDHRLTAGLTLRY